MIKDLTALVTSTMLISGIALGLIVQAHAEESKSPYSAMATLDQYLISDRSAEIALAKTAAPKSISDHAEVLVLSRDGYTTAVKGTNGFVCLVERSWAAPTDAPEFWNPKIRSPQCINAPDRKSVV